MAGVMDAMRMRGSPEGPFPGMLYQPTVDLEHRPLVPMPDGGVATVYSGTFPYRGGAVLLPLISKDGRVIHGREAMENFYKTGEHLGIFDNEDNADRYAVALHQAQARYYGPDIWQVEHPGGR